ncbi:MAG TPA: HPr(Ser) kinase/phosphatase [Gammaproteobacteria bacterium]|nr:HPr(Ser) kinase/phosphatase [Gammaproteobacteria bacterium]
MSGPQTPAELIDELGLRLRLEWVTGQDNADRPLYAEDTSQTVTPLVSHYNPVRPARIQVIGRREMSYLDALTVSSRNGQLAEIAIQPDMVMLVIAAGLAADAELVKMMQSHKVPVLKSSLDADVLIAQLRYCLHGQVSEHLLLHGVFMEVLGTGVLLTGESGIGKSETALELISRGHRLVADDVIECHRVSTDIIEGLCPDLLWEFIEVRGLGVLNIRELFGNSAIKHSKNLRLILKLVPINDEDMHYVDRMSGSRSSRDILGVDIAELTLPVAAGRNLSIVVETAVRNHNLLRRGYDAVKDFKERQQRAIHNKK